MIGSIWDIKKGGKGIVGGFRGGAVAAIGIILFLLLRDFMQYPVGRVNLNGIFWLLVVGAAFVLLGAAIGLIEGVAIWYLCYLATLPRSLRLRAARSLQANCYRPPPPASRA